MKVGLIPLDERPVNTRYPVMIGQIGGVDVLIPPAAALSHYRTPANHDALLAWLHDVAPTLDALIVSFEMLGYGGLIASRISDDSLATILAQFDMLRSIKAKHPALVVYGFNVITRISRHDSATEEPSYWADYGSKLFRLSQLIDRAGQGQPVQAELDALREQIPDLYIDDFLRRRERNHQVNLAALDLLADGTLDLLVLSSDDTSEFGLSSREKRKLARRAGELELGNRFLMYPGADEVGCALVARLINEARGIVPRFQPVYMIPGGEDAVAPFEDGAIKLTVERQIKAAGGAVVEKDADFLLLVNPPIAPDAEWAREYTDAEKRDRLPHLARSLDHAFREGHRLLIADVAFANGGDPALIDLLRQHADLRIVKGYAGWNTAGNSIGTVIAQGCAALSAVSSDQQQAQERFVVHRLIEDWAYQTVVRGEIHDWLETTTGVREPSAENVEAVQTRIEQRLQAVFDAGFPALAHWQIAPGSLRLPWQRTFEIDFELLHK